MNKIKIILLLFLSVYSANAQTSQNDEAEILSASAVKFFKEGKYKEALPLAEKAVKLREQEFGSKHLKTGAALRNLGFIQLGSGDKKEAEKTFERAVEIYEANISDTKEYSNEFGQMLEVIGYLKIESGKIDKAIEYYKKAVEQHEKVFGKDSLEVSKSLWILGNLYQRKKDYKNSEPIYRRILEIRVKKLGVGNSETQDARNRYQCSAVRNDNQVESLNFINSLVGEKTPAGNPENAAINGGVINGKAINLVRPTYPQEARSARASGAVNVQVTIDEEGKVIFACAISGNKLLFDASEVAAYNSTFKPTLLSGKPIAVAGVLVYYFSF